MCLKVYANGVGEGAGTHVSITLTLLKGERDSVHRSGSEGCCDGFHPAFLILEGQLAFNVCQYQPLSQYSQPVKALTYHETFCTHEYVVSKLVNDCLTFKVSYNDSCHLLISVN